jgi:hypothetical protein
MDLLAKMEREWESETGDQRRPKSDLIPLLGFAKMEEYNQSLPRLEWERDAKNGVLRYGIQISFLCSGAFV